MNVTFLLSLLISLNMACTDSTDLLPQDSHTLGVKKVN